MTSRLDFNLDRSIYNQINRIRGSRSWRQFFSDLIPELSPPSQHRIESSLLSFPFELAEVYAKIGLAVKRRPWLGRSRMCFSHGELRVIKITEYGVDGFLNDVDKMADDWIVI